MAYSVFYVELGIALNLTEPDLGHHEYPGLWDVLRTDKRPVPERGLQCIQCRETRPTCPEWMYLTERDGVRFASHFNRSIADHTSGPESDQHKAFKERIARAAEEGGFAAELEDIAESGLRRTDVLVRGDGNCVIGWEVQLSYATTEAVKKRSTIARADGITPLWAGVDRTRDYINKVPWALLDDLPWQHIVGGNALLVRGGVRTLEMYSCDLTSVVPCPVKGVGRCGKRHATWATMLRLQLDTLVRGSAAGEYVPIIVPGKRITNRWWVRAADRDRYVDAVGGLPAESESPAQGAEAASAQDPQPLAIECRYGQDTGYRSSPATLKDSGDLVVTMPNTYPESPPRPVIRLRECGAVANRETKQICMAPARLFPCGWRCETHRPR